MRLSMTQQIIQEGVQQGIQQGFDQGVKQGIELGIKQARLQVRRTTTIDILEHRLGKVSNKLKKQIESIDDENVLLSLVIGAATCGSIKEFQEKL